MFEEAVAGGVGGEERCDGAFVADAAEGLGNGAAGVEVGGGEHGDERVGGSLVAPERDAEGGGGADLGIRLLEGAADGSACSFA